MTLAKGVLVAVIAFLAITLSGCEQISGESMTSSISGVTLAPAVEHESSHQIDEISECEIISSVAELTDMFLWKDTLYCIRNDHSVRIVNLENLHETIIYTVPTDCMARVDGTLYYMLDSILYKIDLPELIPQEIAHCPPIKKAPNQEYAFRLESAGQYLLVYCIYWLDGEFIGSDIWCYDELSQDYKFIASETVDEAYHFFSSKGRNLFAQYTWHEEIPHGCLIMWDIDNSGASSVLYSYDNTTVEYIVSTEVVGDTVYFTMGYSGTLQQVNINHPQSVTRLPIKVVGYRDESSAMRYEILRPIDEHRLILLGYFNQDARICIYDILTGEAVVSGTGLPIANNFVIIHGKDCYYYDILENEIKKEQSIW